MSKARVGAEVRNKVIKAFNGRQQLADMFLATLWLDGVKVVPLDASDLAQIEKDSKR